MIELVSWMTLVRRSPVREILRFILASTVKGSYLLAPREFGGSLALSPPNALTHRFIFLCYAVITIQPVK